MKSIMRRTTGGGGTPAKAAPQQAPRSPTGGKASTSTPRFNANMFDDDEADATLRRMQQMQQPMPTSARMQQQHQLRVQQQQQQMLERQRQQKQQQQAAASRIQQMQQREQTDRQPANNNANDAPTPRISLEQGYVSPHMFQQEEPRQQQQQKQQQKQQLSKQQQPQIQRAQPSPYQPAQPQDRMKFMQQQAVDMNDSSRQYISPSMFESDHERDLEAEEESGLASLLGSRSRSRSPNVRPKSPQRVGSNSSISSNKSTGRPTQAATRQSQLSPPRATATPAAAAAKTSPPRRQTSLQKAVATPAAAQTQAQAPPPGAFEVPPQKQQPQQPAAAAKLTPAQQAQQMKQQQQQAQQRQLQQQQQPAAAAKLTPAQQAQQMKQQQQQEAQQRQLQQQQQQQQAQQQQQQRQVMQQPQQAKTELPAPQEVKPTPTATPNPAAVARSALPTPQQQQPAATNGNGNTAVVQQPASTPTPLQAAAPFVPAAAAAPPQPAVTAMTEEQLNRILAQIQQIQVQVPPPPPAPVVAPVAVAASAAAPAPMKQRELVKPRVGGINRHGAWTGTGHHGRGQEPRTYKCFREFVDEHESFRMLSDIEASCTRCAPGSVPQFGMATVENEDEDKPALYQCMRALQEFMNAHGMEGVFMVIKPDLTEVNMLENPFFATRADVLEWCADLVRGVWTGDPKQNPNTWDRQSACPYDQINSHWAAMALLNSFCSPMLRDCILWSLPEKDRSGPRVLLEMLTRSSPPEFAHMRVGTLVNEITKMSLKDEPDENVQSYNYKLSAKIEEIKINAQVPGKLIPPSLAAITLLGFQDCSDDTLRYEATELLQKAEQRSFPQIEPEGCLQELEALYLDRHFHELYCAGKTIKTKENEENNNNNWSSHGGGLVSYLDGSIRSLNTSRRFGSENEGVRNKPKEKKRPSLSPLPW